MATRNVVSAATVLYVNGQPYGKAFGFRYTSSTARSEKYGLDCTEPFELAPTVSKCTGTVMIYRQAGDGGAEGAGMAASYPNLSREAYFSVMLVDRKAGAVIFQAQRCSLVDQSWEIPSRGVVTGTLTFSAIEWNNEVRASNA